MVSENNDHGGPLVANRTSQLITNTFVVGNVLPWVVGNSGHPGPYRQVSRVGVSVWGWTSAFAVTVVASTCIGSLDSTVSGSLSTSMGSCCAGVSHKIDSVTLSGSWVIGESMGIDSAEDELDCEIMVDAKCCFHAAMQSAVSTGSLMFGWRH